MNDYRKHFQGLPIAFASVLMLMTSGVPQTFETQAADDPMITSKCDTEGWSVLFDGSVASAQENFWITGGLWRVAEDPDAAAAGKLAAGQQVLWSENGTGLNNAAMYTHRRYRNAEVQIGLNPTWLNDGGLFLRANGTGGAYEIMIDYKPGNSVGGIWSEGISAQTQSNYVFETDPATIRGTLIDWDPWDWETIWDDAGYNLLNAAISGDVNIFAWIHDETHWVTDYSQNTTAPELAEDGYVGLQMHGGWVGPNKYSYIKVRELNDGGSPLCIGTGVSVCGISGYQEYVAGGAINDPGKCRTLGTSVTGSIPEAGQYTFSLNENVQFRSPSEIEQVRILDAQGRLLNTVRGKGGSVSWDGRLAHGTAVQNGLYIAEIKGKGFSAAAKSVLIR